MAQLRCNTCFESFNRQSSLTRHCKNAHSQQPPTHRCSSCLKSFSRRDLLLRHERLHRGEGFQPCEICFRRFRRDYLDKHLKTCRLWAWKPLSPSDPSSVIRRFNAPSPLPGYQLQWQTPIIAPQSSRPRETISAPLRGVQQPHRFVGLKSLQDFTADTELLHQALYATDEGDGGLSLFKTAVRAWRARGHSLRRLDELSITANGLTLIARACDNYASDTAAFILSLDLDFQKKDKMDRTALHWLCCRGLTALVEQLLATTIDINLLDVNGDSPLCLASRFEHTDVVRVLCAHGAFTNIKGRPCYERSDCPSASCSPLEYAVGNRARTASEALLQACADPNLRGKLMPLEVAILQGDAREVDLLLTAGAKIDLIEVYYITLLGSSDIAVSESLEKASLLEEYARAHRSGTLFAPNVDMEDMQELHQAIDADDVASFSTCLESSHGRPILVGELRDFVESFSTVMAHGAEQNAVRCLRYMLDSYPNVNIEDDEDGWTALHRACKSGSHDVISLLLDSGARVDFCSNNGEVSDAKTPLCVAAIAGDLRAIQLLLAANANVDGKVEHCNSSPLYWACKDNNGAAAELLLSKGADVNRGSGDVTPLKAALRYGSPSLVSTLLSAGALVESMNEINWSKAKLQSDLKWRLRVLIEESGRHATEDWLA